MFGVSGLEFHVTGFGLRLSDLVFRVYDFGFRDLCFRFWVSGDESPDSGLEF